MSSSMRRSLVYHHVVVIWLMLFLLMAACHRTGAVSLKHAQQRGSIRLCANPEALPYSNRSSQNSLPGFQVELAEAVAREITLGLTVVWVQGPNALRKANCDASMDAIPSATQYHSEGLTGPLTPTVNPLRFTKPYAASGVFLIVPSGSPARRFEELNAHKIGVTVGSVEHAWLEKRGFSVSVFPFQEDIIAAVETGAIGAGAVASAAVGWYRHEHPDARVAIPEGYEPDADLRWNVAMALWGADDALTETIDAALERLLEKRIPQGIYVKYGVTYRSPFLATPEHNH
jgi:polar amino acid transport system substrate-binding protein